jgi:hypothetical protein
MVHAKTFLMGKPEGKGPLGWPGRRCDDKIKMRFIQTQSEGPDWIHLVQDRDK